MKKKNAMKAVALALCTGLLFTGCGVQKNATVVTIDNGADTISLGYANFYARYTQAMYDPVYRSYYGDDYWTADDGEMTTSVKEDVMDGIKRDYVLVAHAGDYDVELSEDDEKAISEAVDEFFKDNSDEAINEMGATKEYVKEYLTNKTISTRVRAAIEASEPEETEEEAAEETTEDETTGEAAEGESTEETTEEESYVDKVIGDWEDELKWKVNEGKWATVKFINLFEDVKEEAEDTEAESSEDTDAESSEAEASEDTDAENTDAETAGDTENTEAAGQ